MNTPNKLTLLRVILIPFFLVFLLTNLLSPWNNIIALIIFIIASLTDFLDGYLARANNMVTNFGKFMDPLADKLLVCAALVAFVQLNLLQAWIVIVIISREFIISGFRLVAASDGIVIAASYWGKFKTNFQIIMIILLIINSNNRFMNILEQIFIVLALIFTIISAVDYMVKNKNVLIDSGK